MPRRAKQTTTPEPAEDADAAPPLAVVPLPEEPPPDAHAPPDVPGVPDRAAIIAALRRPAELSPSGAELQRQVETMDGSIPSPPETADILRRFAAARELGEDPDLGANPFGLRLLAPLAHLFEKDDAPPKLRRLAARAIGALRARRTLSFLSYHALRERDVAVGRAILEALASIGGEAASRTLLKVGAGRREPMARAAIEVLASTGWIQAVPALARIAENRGGERAVHARAAAAALLHLPPMLSSPPDTSAKGMAFEFDAFWSTYAEENPLALVKNAVEMNLGALQMETGVAEHAESNLRALAGDPDLSSYLAPGLEDNRAMSWLIWWGHHGTKEPSQWLAPRVREAMKIPAPSSVEGARAGSDRKIPPARTVEDRRSASRKAVKEAGRFSKHEASLRAIGAGVLSGALFWLFLEFPPAVAAVPAPLRLVAAWSLISMAGGAAAGELRWAVKTLRMGLIGAIGMVILTEGAPGALFWGGGVAFWALTGAGFFQARRSGAGPVSGAILGAGTFFLFRLVVGDLVAGLLPWGFAQVGLFAALFWGIQYIPLRKP